MKKYLFPALALGLVMTSCQSDEPFAPVEGGEKQVTFTLNVPGELGTRAAAGANKSGVGGVSNEGTANIQYTLVLDANGDKKILDNDDADINGTTATFSPTVVLGRNYKIAAYASLDGAWDGATPIAVTKHFNDETKDAYFHTTTHNFAEGDLQPLTLKRPYGKLRLLATDYKVDGSGVLNTEVDKVTITYNDAQAAEFDVFNSEFNFAGNYGNTTAQDFGYYDAEEDGSMPIFADYIPANPGDNMVDFTVTVKYKNSTETYSRTFNDIPVKRNALTTLKGNFFTAGAEITVEVDDNFDNSKEENIKFVLVSNASQLQDAINNGGNGETIILTNDIELTEPLVFGGSFVLNLNGNDIAGIDTTTANYGLITIKKGADLTIEGNGTISLEATQDREWNAYSSVISNQQGKLTVNGGTIQHKGGTSMAYAIDNLTNGKGTYAETIINGGTIKSTYRAIRQFLNGVEAQNILTVNGGTIKGDNKSIWMQDPSKNANTGTLYVGADAQLYGDVYLFVTAGSTEWPVEAKIAKAALKGESKVLSANVPAGCFVEENDDYYEIVSIDDMLEENFEDNSWENIILACQLNKVKESWNVGDKKTMTIGGTEYKIAIIGKDHDTYTDGGKAPLTFQLVDKVYGTAAMNATQTNATGWSRSKMRNETMEEILKAMPVKDAIKTVYKLTLKGDGSELETTSDKLFLLSEIEVNGSTFYSNNLAEGSKYAYYEVGVNKIMNASWWLRGPGINNGKNNGIGFTQINMSGYMANGSAETSVGVVFGFCF